MIQKRIENNIKLLYVKRKIKYYFCTLRVVSSVGLEHYLDRVGVTGSNPVQPTEERVRVRVSAKGSLFLFWLTLITGLLLSEFAPHLRRHIPQVRPEVIELRMFCKEIICFEGLPAGMADYSP